MEDWLLVAVSNVSSQPKFPAGIDRIMHKIIIFSSLGKIM